MTQHDPNRLAMIVNAAQRRLNSMFPGYFQGAKHNHYADFGWPTTLSFDQMRQMYERNGLARAAVMKDNKRFREPVDRVPGGLAGLVEIIPAWEGQLRVSQWDTDERSESYGQPLMFNFNEANVDPEHVGRNRAFEVHPDRVVIFSDDGTVHGTPLIEAGYNDLLTLEKVGGAGGEGFWKNAKSAPVLEVDSGARLEEMARAMDTTEAGLVDAMNEQVEDWQKGFDQLLMLQGIQAKTLGVTLPIPEHFRAGPLENFAASIECPVKILVGMQTGERASKEDAEEWARTAMARRNDSVVPNLMELVRRLEVFGIIPDRDWRLDWADLTEAGMAEKIDRAHKMAETNAKMAAGGELVFLPEEIREAVGMKPLSEAETTREE